MSFSTVSADPPLGLHFPRNLVRALSISLVALGPAVAPGGLLAAGTAEAAAQQIERTGQAPQASGPRDELQIQQGTAEVMTAPLKFSTLIVGNNNVAQVSAVDADTIAITGLGVGQTNLLVLDADGLVQFEWDISVVPPRTGGPVVYRSGEMEVLTCNPICTPAFGGPGTFVGADDGAGGGANTGAGAATSGPTQ